MCERGPEASWSLAFAEKPAETPSYIHMTLEVTLAQRGEPCEEKVSSWPTL